MKLAAILGAACTPATEPTAARANDVAGAAAPFEAGVYTHDGAPPERISVTTDAGAYTEQAARPYVVDFVSTSRGGPPPKPLQAPTSLVRTPPSADVQLGLGARGDLDPSTRSRVASAVDALRVRVRACIQSAVEAKRSSVSGWLTVQVRAPGERAAAIVSVGPEFDAAANACIERCVKDAMGGDEKPASLSFQIGVVAAWPL